MRYPHTFAYLRDPERPAVFVYGAGASFGLNPLPNEILRDRRAEAEAEISRLTGKPFPPVPAVAKGQELYVWAEVAEDALIAGGCAKPKLTIAKLLGITTEPRWLAGATRPSANSMPRHRVLARLAREQCIQSIWTFNWDCHIESSLEAIGFQEKDDVGNQPWPSRYQRICSLADYGTRPHARTIAVHKRHGCVRSLKDLERKEIDGSATPADYSRIRFLITRRELAEVQDKASPEYLSFQGQIDSEFSGRPLAVCGWSASEKYLLDEFQKCAQSVKAYPNASDRLAVVDPTFNTDGHQRLAAIYGVSERQCHFPISPAPGHPSIDELFLWLQALYALSLLDRTIDDNRALQAWLRRELALLEANPSSHWIASWVDLLLPAWVQMCWRLGLVTASYRGRKLSPDDIRLEGEDWYVPLAQNLPERPELTAATHLLHALSANPASYRYDLVPGAFFHTSSATLLLPLPVWGEIGDANYLNTLPRVVDRVRRVGGFIARVRLVAVTLNGSAASLRQKSELLAAYRKFSSSSSGFGADVVDLDAI